MAYSILQISPAVFQYVTQDSRNRNNDLANSLGGQEAKDSSEVSPRNTAGSESEAAFDPGPPDPFCSRSQRLKISSSDVIPKA